jgi:hypothetical protein
MPDNIVERLKAYRGGDCEYRALMDEAASLITKAIEALEQGAKLKDEVARAIFTAWPIYSDALHSQCEADQATLTELKGGQA